MAKSNVNGEGEGKSKCLIVLNGIHLMSDIMILPWSMPFSHSREVFPNFNKLADFLQFVLPHSWIVCVLLTVTCECQHVIYQYHAYFNQLFPNYSHLHFSAAH